MTIKKVQVCVLSKNQEKDLCVLLLQTNKKRGAFWQNITGSVEPEEALEVAAQREFKEETGLSLAQSDKWNSLEDQFDFLDQKDHQVSEHIFLCFLSSSLPSISLDPHEHQAYQWIKVSDITPDHYRYDSNYQTLQKSLSYVKNNYS